MKDYADNDNLLIAAQKKYYDTIYMEYEEKALNASFSHTGDEFSKKVLSHIPHHALCLELACGPGIWTKRLLSKAEQVLAIDASSNMLRRNKLRCASSKVSYVQEDIFNFSNFGTFQVIFASFWISHIPENTFIDFLKYIHKSLSKSGMAIFIDSYPNASPSSGEHRTLNNSTVKIIKNNYFTHAHLHAIKQAGFSVISKELSRQCYLIKAIKL